MKFSKQDTLIVKGVAILMLLGYHCFSCVSRFNGYEVVFPLLPQENAIYVYESMNICVGIFAFLSSFGLTKSIMSSRKKNRDLSPRISETTFITKRLISLEGSFVLPAVLCVIATRFINPNYNPYGVGADYTYYFIADMLGVGCLIGGKNFIGTWWYMSLAVVIILLTPFTVRLYEKYGLAVFVPYLILPLIVEPNFYSYRFLENMNRWLLTIPFGVVFAKLNIFGRLKMKCIFKNKMLDKTVKLILHTAILCLLFAFRTYPWGRSHVEYITAAVLPVYFVYYLYEFVNCIPILKSVLTYFGKHSSNIFFMHTFIRSVWFPDITYSLKYSPLIFAFVLGTSLAMSYVIIFIKYITKYDKGVKWLENKIVSWECRLFSKTSA